MLNDLLNCKGFTSSASARTTLSNPSDRTAVLSFMAQLLPRFHRRDRSSVMDMGHFGSQ